MTRFEPTPNPNALKCVTDQTLADGIRSYRTSADADDELSQAVFAIEGVTSLLINGTWMTVNKAPSAPWPPIKRAVTELLESR